MVKYVILIYFIYSKLKMIENYYVLNEEEDVQEDNFLKE